MNNEQHNRRVLVIDDQESIREDFQKILGGGESADGGLQDARNAFFGAPEEVTSSVSFDLETASQGLDGIELARQAHDEGRPFAMAFVDVRMPPGLDGVQTIRKLWEIDAELQVVICTAFSDYSFEEIVEELGQSDRLLILKKPFDPVEVRQLAGALTEKWNMLARVREQMDELRAANERAEAASRAKTQFLANMSHEIRTPMNALLGYVSLMCDPAATLEDRRLYGRTIRKSGEHLLTILGDILDISRIEASRLLVNTADFSPFEVVREVAALMSAQAYEKDLAISVEVQGPIPEIVESDRVRVRQILINLLGNAIKFTPSGEVKLVLRLDENTTSDHRYLYIDVVDTGVGIDEAEVEQLFQPFHQADESMTREHGGTGLGLSIAKRLALLLGGDVDARRNEGRGSTFRLKLYAGELGRALLRDYSEGECSLEPRPGSDARPKASSAADLRLDDVRVLVVEDVKFNQQLFCAILRAAGAKTASAEDGQEGVEVATKASAEGQPFDLVLMDMQMPVLDGYDATRKLREDGYRGPILALTAHAMKGDRERCLEAGCDDYATKPVDREVLLQLCRRMIDLAQSGAPLPSAERDRAASPELD